MFLHSICWWLLEPFDINDKFSVQILIKPFHLLALKKFCWDYLITNIGRKSLTSTTTNLHNKHFSGLNVLLLLKNIYFSMMMLIHPLLRSKLQKLSLASLSLEVHLPLNTLAFIWPTLAFILILFQKVWSKNKKILQRCKHIFITHDSIINKQWLR